MKAALTHTMCHILINVSGHSLLFSLPVGDHEIKQEPEQESSTTNVASIQQTTLNIKQVDISTSH